jgi:predicted nuclease of restriction endonuclease-like (RecB) superfamily
MNYSDLIQAFRQTHEEAHASAAKTVNRHLVLRNWLFGAYLIEFQQNGEDRAQYGAKLLKRVSADLRRLAIPGTSVDQLERMRLLYSIYPQLADGLPSSISKKLSTTSAAPLAAENSASVVRKSPGEATTSPNSAPAVRKSAANEPALPTPLPAQRLLALSWTHFLELLRLEDPWKRAFYENECLKGNWAKRQLQRQIGSLLYERTGLSTDKQAVIEHARQQALETPGHMADLIRDPYVLEFIGLAEKSHYLEKDLETALLDHLQSFLLELGTGFCFEARQKRITVGDEHDYLDLVFYHRILRCHLLIDLKVRPFKHGDAGQMNFYLNYWKDNMLAPGDEPPIGLILCTDKKETRVSYATAGLDQQLFVSRYLVALPKPEELQALIDADTAAWEQHHPIED